jgi:energy-coupling factor transporter ATP-binding protein EcfA2
MNVTKPSSSWFNQQTTKLPQKNEERFPALLINKPHITLVCGAKGSGKSQLVCRLLLTAYKKVYDEIIFVSPTFESQIKSLWGKLSPEGIRVVDDLSQEFVDGFLIDQSKSSKNTLLVLDDVGQAQRQLKGNSWMKLIANSRHYKLSIISLHQKLTQADTCIRVNADTIVCFPSCSYGEREALYKARSTVDRKTFMDLFRSATIEDYSFLVCTVRSGNLRFYMSDFKTDITPL